MAQVTPQPELREILRGSLPLFFSPPSTPFRVFTPCPRSGQSVVWVVAPPVFPSVVLFKILLGTLEKAVGVFSFRVAYVW